MPAIGIDLGTTNSCVAVYRNDRIEIIANDEGSRVTPSFVSFTEHERLVGEAAKREASFNFENSLFQIKRLMGRTYNDPIVQSDMKLWGFKVIDADNKPTIQVTFRSKPHELCPEEVSGLILEYLKKTAEDFLGEPVTDAVITVPAYFNDAQRSATRDAGTIAGLNVLRMVNEPTAAAIAYGLDREKAEEQNVLIFDLGGGTFDVTVVRIKDKTFEVRATGGDTHLGGDDFDNNMVKHFVKDFNSKNKCDMSKNKRGINRLRVACEAAKRKLSVSTNATVEVDGLHNGIDYKSKITRTEFERLNYEIFAQTIQTVEKVLEDAKIGTGEIDNIVLVGGSTRIPKIRKLIEDNFEDTKISRTINPDEAVAYGAAVLAAKVSPEDMPKLDNMNLHDVAPLSLGWRNARGDMVTVVRRNSRIPIEKWSRSTTAEDHQTSVTMSIYEGERPAAKDNNHLGSFKLDDIPSARRGVEKFEICFRVDENGILTVSERIVSTGKHNQTTIGNKGRLTPEQVSDIAQQANQFRKEDAAWKERSKRRHKLENYVYFVKHSAESEEFNGKISSKNKEEIRDKCSEIVSWLKEIENPEIEDSEQKQEELEQTCLPIFAMLPGGSKILEKLANFE